VVPVLRLFAAAREAASATSVHLEGKTVGEVLAAATSRFGPALEDVIGISRVWVNGEPAGDGDPVGDNDEVAVIPPVSGGCA
jgi:molybdopterin synthase sulfur carrier subunit